MKTIRKTLKIKQLEITYDTFAESPRNDDNLSLLILRGVYGDKNELLKSLLEETGLVANNAEHHLSLMKEKVNQTYGKILFADFITKYEHSGICLKRGLYKGFDYALIGFVFVTEKKLKSHHLDLKSIKKFVDTEIETYNHWINGEVYEFCLYNENGDMVDNCSGFYDIEDIKECLPNDWQGEEMENYCSF